MKNLLAKSPAAIERAAKHGKLRDAPHQADLEKDRAFRREALEPESGSAADSIEKAVQAALGHLSQEDQDEVARSIHHDGDYVLEIGRGTDDDVIVRIVGYLVHKARELPARRAAERKLIAATDKVDAWSGFTESARKQARRNAEE